MKLRERTIEYNDDNVQVRLVIQAATALIGLRRTRLRLEAQEAIQEEQNTDAAILRMVVYPDLMAPVTEAELAVEGEEQAWPVSFEVFAALPERLVTIWEQAVYELNPHWLPADEEEDRKKVLSSTSA